MNSSFRHAMLALVLLGLGLGLGACHPEPPRLTLQKVVLYQNGIGYFEHTGAARGRRIELRFRPHEIGDVLKTITILDASGRGATATVTAFAVRGRRDSAPGVSAGHGAAAENGKKNSPSGQASHEERPADDGIPLAVELTRPSPSVLITYAVPQPAWKPSYRLVLAPAGGSGKGDKGADTRAGRGGQGKRALLQGWASVTNDTEKDWRGVALTLATGEPLSFAIDLHSPEYVARPDLTGKLIKPVTTGAITSERSLSGDGDGDGIDSAGDLCPEDAEDRDSFEDTDGCPDPDNDRDRILDGKDQCPTAPETYNGIDDDDGCPDRGRVVVTDTSIEILDKVYFAAGQAELRPESLPIIQAIAATLIGNADIRKIAIQGHAAAPEQGAWELSRRRASTVYRALKDLGVTTTLVVEPYGATQPIDMRGTANAHAKNRRAEFLILERDDEGGPSQPSGSSGLPASAPSGSSGSADAAGGQRGMQAVATPRDVAGSVRYDITTRVTIPSGAAALVPILNHSVDGEDIYLFRPEQDAPDSAMHPWRAARLVNQTAFPLQPGPVAIFTADAFAGEGIIERLYPGEVAYIPYALDSATAIVSETGRANEPAALLAIARGVATFEDRDVKVTRYLIRTAKSAPGRVFIRHQRTAGFEARDLPPLTEEYGDVYFIPVPLTPGRQSILEVRETTPVRREVTLLEDAPLSPQALAVYLKGDHIPAPVAEAVKQAVEMRASLAQLDEDMDALVLSFTEVGARADEIRESLKVLGQGGQAAALRASLIAQLKQAMDELARLSKELEQKRAARSAARVRLVEAVRALSLDPARAPAREAQP